MLLSSSSSGGFRFGFGFLTRAISRPVIRTPIPKFTFNKIRFSPEEIPLLRIPERKLSAADFRPPPRDLIQKYSALHPPPPRNFVPLDAIPKSSVLGVDHSPLLPKSKPKPSFDDELPAVAQDKRPKSSVSEEDRPSASKAKEHGEMPEIEIASEEDLHSSERREKTKSKDEIPHIHADFHGSEHQYESPQHYLPRQDEKPKENGDKDGE